MLAGGIWDCPGFLWGDASPWRVLWVGWNPLSNAVYGDRLDLDAKGSFWPVREGLLLPSLAATYVAGIRSLLPLTKSFPRHLRCSVQAVVRAPSS